MVVINLYAIYCKEDKAIIWNARGSAYKKTLDVERKLKKLKEQYPKKTFRIIKYTLDAY